MNSIDTFVCATPDYLASVAEAVSKAMLSGEALMRVTIDQSGALHTSVLTRETYMVSESSATDTGRGVQWTIESGSLPELDQSLLIRLNVTKPPSTTPSKT